MDEKVYIPEVIQETPFPGISESLDTQTQNKSGGNYSPVTTKPKQFPTKRTAVELISTSLNTRSRKVLKEFQLQQAGGFQIGNFEEGISGDLRITPNGLTARNIAGITTFAIDGDTGDATFLGILQAGTLVGGDNTVIIDTGGAGGGRIVLYNDGIPQILIGDSA